jgi:hypothetical protein
MKLGGSTVRFAIGIIAIILTSCGSPVSSMQTSMQVDPEYIFEHLIPELTVPDGAEELGGGGGGGPNARGIGTYFKSDLEFAAVEQHYVDQLTAAGWRLITREAEEDSVTIFWELSDPDGGIWSGRLMVVYSPPDFPETYLADVAILLPQ